MANKKNTKKKIVKAIEQDEHGRNTLFKDIGTGKIMTDKKFMNEIDKGNYPDHIVVENPHGARYPRSKPSKSNDDNIE